MMKLYIILISIIFAIIGKCVGKDSSARNAAAKEILSIVQDPARYDSDIMPNNNGSGPLQVKISMHVLSLEIDDINMKTNVDLYFRMHWNDPRLSYKLLPVESVKFARTSDFWVPDAFFRNSFRTEMMDSILPESLIKIAGNGDVTYSARFYLSLKCSMNLKNFPHDQQSCPLHVESYGYTTKDLVFEFKNPSPFSLSQDILTSKRFTLDRVSSDYATAKTSSGDYACLSLYFNINRTFTSYLLEWYLPCVALVITAFLAEVLEPTLILPRLLITVGPLLTFVATSLSYHETLPTVPYATALDIFCGVSLLTIFITVLHVFAGFYYSSEQTPEAKSDEEGPNQKWQNIFHPKKRVNNLAKLLIIGSYVLFLISYLIAYI